MRLRHRPPSSILPLGLVALLLGATQPTRAQQRPPDPAGEAGAQRDAPLRGGAFEIGPVFGYATFSDKARFDPCHWRGLRVGHRFDPFPGIDRLQLEFRAGLEGCFTEHAEIGRVDVIHLQLSWLLGLAVSEKWRIYWGAGLGELLADSTPGSDDQVLPRFSVHLMPGVTWTPTNRWLIDVSMMGVVFENYDFGTLPVGGTTLALVPSLFVAVQI